MGLIHFNMYWAIFQGNLFHIQTTANQVNTREIWDNATRKKFIEATFLQPDETHFATLDENANAQIFLLKQKEQVSSTLLC